MTAPRRAALALALGALVVATAPAAAQSRRYPAPPVDAEAAAEARSDFWDEVVRPGARRYEQLVTAATDGLRLSAGDPTRARDTLLEAVALRADVAEGWGYLGVATEKTREWTACAAAYGKAYALDPRWRPARLAGKGEVVGKQRTLATRPLELGWAMCLSRSGELADATDALEALVARGEATGEAWLRLGEVYMAEGRLAEAIAALDQARTEPAVRGLARWLLAVAHDRARHPAAAEAAAAEAGDIDNPTRGPIPFVPAADVYYVRAFAARHAPERALALFRTYLERAPADSPWRARAQEHVDALGDVDLATRVELEGTGDRAAVEKTVRAALPALRRCVAAVPTVVIELRITQLGPPGRRAPPPPPPPRRGLAPVRSRSPVVTLGRRPPEAQTPGVRAMPVIFEPGSHDAARDLAVDCVEKLGLGLTLPRPPADSYATVRIPVVAAR